VDVAAEADDVAKPQFGYAVWTDFTSISPHAKLTIAE